MRLTYFRIYRYTIPPVDELCRLRFSSRFAHIHNNTILYNINITMFIYFINNNRHSGRVCGITRATTTGRLPVLQPSTSVSE